MKSVSRRTLAIVIFSGLLMLIGVPALYAYHGHGGRCGFGGPGQCGEMFSLYLTKQLNLDSSQQQQLDTIMQAVKEKRKALFEVHKNTRSQLVTILQGATVDPQAIQALQDQNRAAGDDLIAQIGSGMTEFVNILTPDQRQLFATFLQKHRRHHAAKQ